jgi:glyoxylase-like metal-dependent hydrolase (beta-lactamase superfamily II)
MKTWATGTTELAPGVFAYVQATGGFCIANAGLIDGGDAVTAIDALFSPPMTQSLLDEARRVADRPIARLINTHHHVDHTLGNAMFPRETHIIAHAKARAEMERTGIGVLDIIKRMAPHFTEELDGASARLPDVTFDGDAMDVTIGRRQVRLLHFGWGHTRGDVVVLLPEERVLFTGDLGFFYVTPLAHEGHIGNWIRIGRRIIGEVDAHVLVPGHGPIGTKDDLRAMLDYLETVRDEARAAFEAGMPPRDAAAAIDLGEYAEWGESERVSFNVARLYAEFRGELIDDESSSGDGREEKQ